MKTEIVLCDNCKDRIGKGKCAICEKDICDGCSEDLPIQFGWNEGEFLRLKFCKICKGEIKDLLKVKKHDIEKFSRLIVKYLKDNMVLKELEK